MCTYKLIADSVTDEDGKSVQTYGLIAVDGKGETRAEAHSIFFDKSRAESFAALCNKEELALIHFPDVIEDALYESCPAK